MPKFLEVTNTRAAKEAINADFYVNVKDYGAVGDGDADDTAAINDAIAALPELGGTYLNAYGSVTRETQGGGTIVIPAGQYKISAPILVGSRVHIIAYGATFIASHASACVKLIQNPQAGLFQGHGSTVEGLTFDGNDVATNGFWLQSTFLAGLDLCMVVHTTGDGFRLEGSQYTTMNACHATECGGWGLSVTKNAASTLPDGNNNTFNRFVAEMNTSGGVRLYDGAIQNTFSGLTSQFHPTGVGLLMTGSPVIGNSVFGAHFEQNQVDVEFQAAVYNQVYSPVFWRGPETTRHVISNGQNNHVSNPVIGSTDGPQVQRAGTTACYEIGASGTLIMDNPRRITGSGTFASDGSLMFVDESGDSLDPKTDVIGSARVVVREADDPRQAPQTYFNKHTYAASFSGEPLLSMKLTTDSNERLIGYANGNLAWGAGSAAVDTTLSRLASGKLAVNNVEIPSISSTSTLTNKTFESPKIDLIKDTVNNGTVLAIGGPPSSVNYFYMYSAAGTAHPILYATGSATNVGMYVIPKGSGSFILYGQTGQASQTIAAQGSATDVSLNLTSQGDGAVNANGNPVAVKVAVPAATDSPGKPGQWAIDDANSKYYICTAANTWKRFPVTFDSEPWT